MTSISSGLSSIASGVRSAINTPTALATSLSPVASGILSTLNLPTLIKGDADNVTGSFMGALDVWLEVGDKIGIETGSNPITFEAMKAAMEALNKIGGLAGHPELFNTTLPENWATQVLELYVPSYGFGGYNQLLLGPLTSNGVREVEILPGDDLVKIATRELGSAERFQEIVVLNNLKPPYISPSAEDRLPNTLAPRDPILLPSTGTLSAPRAPISTTIYTDPTFTGRVLSHSLRTTTVDTGGRDWRVNQWSGFSVEIISGLGAGQELLVTGNEAASFTSDKDWVTNPDSTSVVRFHLKRTGVAPKKSVNAQVLGVDLRLRDGDLQISSRGDISMVDGVENMTQAVQTKFKTHPGELASHPSFGLPISTTGTRANPDNMLTFKLAVKQALLADRRVTSIQQINISVEGDKLMFQAYVTLTGSSQPFSVNTFGGV
jgi:hypothetical protein